MALEDADKTDMVTVWMAITDATVENGCLQVQPQTNDQDILPHCPRTQTGIADGFINEASAIPLPVHRRRRSAVSSADTACFACECTLTGFRWSFDIRFSATGQPTGRSHFPDFIARSRSNLASEMTRLANVQSSVGRRPRAAVPKRHT